MIERRISSLKIWSAQGLFVLIIGLEDTRRLVEIGSGQGSEDRDTLYPSSNFISRWSQMGLSCLGLAAARQQC